MIDPLNPLFQAHDQVTAAIMPNAADPHSALAVMIVGIIIITATAMGSLAGLSAAIWVRLRDMREQRFQSLRRGTDNPSAR